MSYSGPIITIYRTRCHTLSGGPNPTNNSDVYNLFALLVSVLIADGIERKGKRYLISLGFNMIIAKIED